MDKSTSALALPAAPIQRASRPATPTDRRKASFPVPLTREPPQPPAGQQRGAPPPSRGSRAAAFNGTSYDATARTVEAVFSAGAAVRRWFGTEVLAVSPEAVDLTRVASNLCPFLNAHNQYDIGAVLGRVVDARIEGGQLIGTLAFADTDAGRIAEGMVSRGELTGISIGYAVRTWTLTEQTDDADTWTATSWELLEVSLVPVPADPSAGVRSAETSTTPAGDPATTQEDDDMNRNLPGGGVAHPNANRGAAPGQPAGDTTIVVDPADTRTEPNGQTDPAGDGQRTVVVVTGETVNVAAIRTAVTNAGLGDAVTFELIERHEATPLTRDALLADIGRRFAERDSRAQTPNRISVTRDAGDTMRRGIEEALFHRISPRHQLADIGRDYRGMSLLRTAEELLTASGVSVRGMSPNEIAERSLTSTSDLPALMANSLNRRLRAGYAENQPSYRRWARQAPSAPNFKSIDVTQMSALPDLLKVNEAGEVKFGSISDGNVSYKVLTYARAIGFTRQTIVNDDLRALERVTSGFSAAASRLENRLVYANLTGNANLPDGNALFSAAHKNLGAAAAISATSLSAARTRMRLQKGLANEELNLSPAYLIVPAELEQLAYQYTSSNYVPAKQSDVNEFRAGGRTSVEPIVEAVLSADSAAAWYMLSDSADVDTVEWCYLEGTEGPQFASRVGFTVDGVEFKVTHDFGTAAIDFRGMDKTAGQ